MTERFALCGARVLTLPRALDVLSHSEAFALAWGRPGASPVVVATAEDFARLTGKVLHRDTFRPSRFCRHCAAFTGGRRCLSCSPLTVDAVRGAR